MTRLQEARVILKMQEPPGCSCRKLTQVQLPYAWYQASHFCLTAFTVTLPYVAAFWMNEYWLAVPTAGLTVLLFATMNEIANSIEEPFKFYPALIPLRLKQMQFNERLIAISDTRRPMGFADVLKDVNNPRGYLECKRSLFKVGTASASLAVAFNWWHWQLSSVVLYAAVIPYQRSSTAKQLLVLVEVWGHGQCGDLCVAPSPPHVQAASVPVNVGAGVGGVLVTWSV